MDSAPRSSPRIPSMAVIASSPSPYSLNDSELYTDSFSSPSASSRSASETSSNYAEQGLRQRSGGGEARAGNRAKGPETPRNGAGAEATRNRAEIETPRNGPRVDTPRSGMETPRNGARAVLETPRNARGAETPRNGRSMTEKDKKGNGNLDGHGHGNDDDDRASPEMRRFHGSLCCKCAAGFTADCAAVCCCPLALLHLAAMAFIRLPSAMAWKMIVNLKNKSCLKKQQKQKQKKKQQKQRKVKKKKERTGEAAEGGGDEGEDSDSDSSSTDEDDNTARSPWHQDPSAAIEDFMSRPISPALHLHQNFHHHHGLQLVTFDSENLLQHFQTEQMDFGGYVQKIE